jgi:hypothetical protein
MRAINTFAIPVLSYSFGVIDWTINQIEEINKNTRGILIRKGVHVKGSSTERIYMKRNEGGRGLINLISMHDNIRTKLINKMKERNDKYARIINEYFSETREISKSDEVIKRQEIDVNELISNKKLHGKRMKDIEKNEIDLTLSSEWMIRNRSKRTDEALLFSIQDQSIPTRNRIKKIFKKNEIDSKCRMCESENETIGHILGSCPKLLQKEIKERHDSVARMIHWQICKDRGMKVSSKWFDHKPESVVEISDDTILWDHNIQTDRTLVSNRPDIVIIMKDKIQIIDVGIPLDSNVKETELSKMDKYQELGTEMRKIHGIEKKSEVIPIVISATGCVRSGIRSYIERISKNIRLDKLEMCAIQGSLRIIRKVILHKY